MECDNGDGFHFFSVPIILLGGELFAINSISFPIIRGVVEFFRVNQIIMEAVFYLGKPKIFFKSSQLLHNLLLLYA